MPGELGESVYSKCEKILHSKPFYKGCAHKFEPWLGDTGKEGDRMICPKCRLTVPWREGEFYNQGFEKGKEVILEGRPQFPIGAKLRLLWQDIIVEVISDEGGPTIMAKNPQSEKIFELYPCDYEIVEG